MPHAGIGVPGRPYVMMVVTLQTVPSGCSLGGSEHSGSSWNRWSTVLSGGTCQTTLLPSTTHEAWPPPPSAPWQFAHSSDCVGL